MSDIEKKEQVKQENESPKEEGKSSLIEAMAGHFDHKLGAGLEEDLQRRARNLAWIEKMREVAKKANKE